MSRAIPSKLQPAPEQVGPKSHGETNPGIQWSNWALVIVGIAGTCVALRTLDQLKAQITVAQRSLALTHRPKLIVRYVNTAVDYPDQNTLTVRDAELLVVNIGDLPTTLIRSYSEILVKSHPPSPEHERKEGTQHNAPLPPGASTRIAIGSEPRSVAQTRLNGGWDHVWAVGWN